MFLAKSRAAVVVTLGAVARPFARSPVRPFARSPVRPFARSPVRPFARSPVRPFARSPVRPFARSPVRPFARSPVRPFARSPVRPFARSLIRPDGDARLSCAPRPEQRHQTPKPPRSKIRGHFGAAVHTPGHNEPVNVRRCEGDRESDRKGQADVCVRACVETLGSHWCRCHRECRGKRERGKRERVRQGLGVVDTALGPRQPRRRPPRSSCRRFCLRRVSALSSPQPPPAVPRRHRLSLGSLLSSVCVFLFFSL
ncbi:hypothetical protein X777_09949 [Ooceraea biroi]|uniref:Uncharacterized protein n=1 Tax=Ooceraea biroi TaxID=2015173 RepID=A0A026W5C3_OOCBI|nr:hypothetical protein X777_09949 [Ooceraea biroi]